MSYKVITFPAFDRQAKRLTKKYGSLKNEIAELIRDLKENPKQGVSLGLDCYKIRLAISSKGKGKSGGARVITHIYLSGDTVILLTLYDKSEQADISMAALKKILESLY